MKIQAFILSGILVLPISVAGQSSDYVTNNKASNNTSQLSRHDKLFLHTIASEDQSEIELAKLALQKSQDAQIRQYANTKILAADPSMEEQAKQIAAQNHTSISSTPNATAKLEYKQFSNFTGKQFDRAYVKYEGWKQAADLKAVQREAASADSPQVREYAQKEQTPVQQASQAALQLAHAMNVAPQQ